MTTDEAPAALARSKPKRTTSYSASLLVVGNWRRMVHSTISPSSDYRTTPPLPTRWLDELSVHKIHVAGPSSSSSFAVNSATKSTKAWALIVVLGWYSMLNSSSSIAHKIIHPAAFGIFIALCNGLSVWTIMVYAWKYGLSFRAAVIREKASFSMRGYLPSALGSARLV